MWMLSGDSCSMRLESREVNAPSVVKFDGCRLDISCGCGREGWKSGAGGVPLIICRRYRRLKTSGLSALASSSETRWRCGCEATYRSEPAYQEDSTPPP